MRNILSPIFLAGLLFLLTSAGEYADLHHSDVILKKMSTAFRQGDAAMFGDCFNGDVELFLPDVKGTFSSTDAVNHLTTFFKNHPVKTFDVKYQRSTAEGFRYIIATYTSEKKRVFRIDCHIKHLENEISTLHKIEIE